jgi:hypothetical protein
VLARALTTGLLALGTGMLVPAVGHGAEPGGITGTVTDAMHSPLPGIEVCALPAGGMILEESAEAPLCSTSDTLGHYVIAGIPPGTYFVLFTVPFTSNADYIAQFYPGKEQISEATQVTISAGANTSGIDAEMQPGGAIAGTVTEAASGAPLEHALVCATGAAEEGNCGISAASGEYTVIGLPTGAYKVEFFHPGFLVQAYPGVPPEEAGAVVNVTVGSTTSGINAALVARPPNTGGPGPGLPGAGGPGSEGPSGPGGGTAGQRSTNPRIEAVLRSSTIAVRDGSALVSLACDKTSPCRGSLRLFVERAERPGVKPRWVSVLVGARGYGLAGGRAATFAVRLAASEQGLLAGAVGGLRARLQITEKLTTAAGSGEAPHGQTGRERSASRRASEVLEVRLRRRAAALPKAARVVQERARGRATSTAIGLSG